MLSTLRRTGPAADDRGLTLVELMVTMVVGSIVLALTFRLVTMVNTAAAATTDRTVGTDRARAALLAWSGYLQVADNPNATGSSSNRFEWFTASDIVFHADLYNRSSSSSAAIATTGAPTTVWLRLDSKGQLVEEQFTGTPSGYPATPTVCRILIPLAHGNPLFTAYDASGNNLTGADLGVAPAVGAGCQPLPVKLPSLATSPDYVAMDNLQDIASVQIDFTVTDGTGSHPLEFATTVSVPVVAS